MTLRTERVSKCLNWSSEQTVVVQHTHTLTHTLGRGLGLVLVPGSCHSHQWLLRLSSVSRGDPRLSDNICRRVCGAPWPADNNPLPQHPRGSHCQGPHSQPPNPEPIHPPPPRWWQQEHDLCCLSGSKLMLSPHRDAKHGPLTNAL